MATGGEVNHEVNKILGINDLNEVIGTLERSGFSEHKWNELGLKLHISQIKLNTVKANNPQDVKGCLRGCLDLWLQQDYDDVDEHGLPTLELLATAVKKMGSRAVASRINQGSTLQSQKKSSKEIKHIIEVYLCDHVKNLSENFAVLMGKIVVRLLQHVKNGVINPIEMVISIGVSIWVRGLKSTSVSDLFAESLYDHYSYLNSDLIQFVVEKFLTDKDQDLKDKMEAYKKDFENFEKTIRLKQLEKALDDVCSTHSHTSCKVIIKLVGEWENQPLANLKKFLRQYFEKDSLFNLSSITDGCLSVTFLVPLSFSQYLIDAATPQLKSMSRVGVLQLIINDVVLLDEKDDINLNESLIEAVKIDDTFEVSLLLSLGADPHYENSNGDKVLELAVQGGNEEIMELISVAADSQIMELENENEESEMVIQRLQDINTAEVEISLATSDKLQETMSLQKKETQEIFKKKLNTYNSGNYTESNSTLAKSKDDSLVLRDKIMSLEAEVSRLRIEAIVKKKMLSQQTKLDQSTQSMEILLPEIDRNEVKIKGVLTIADLSDVLNLLKRCCFPQTRWKELGLALGLHKKTLDTLEMTLNRDVSHCLMQCIARWLSRANDVDSKGGATFDSLSDALKSMNDNTLVEKLSQEKRNTVLAIDIFNTHHPLLSQSLSDPVSVAIMLQREGVITGQVLASVVSASPSVPNQREVLLAAIIVAIESKYSLLQTFASVLCKFTGNIKLGTVIQRDYDKHFSTTCTDEVNLEKKTSSISMGTTIASSSPCSPSFSTTATVQIPVSKDLLEDFISMRMSFGRMMYHVSKVIKQKPLPLDDLKDFLLCAYGSNLKAKLDEHSDISNVFHVIRNECSLINISLLEATVEEFDITEAERYIESYRTTLKEFCKSISVSLNLKERFNSIPHHLQCETITLVLDWQPEEHMLQDIKEILAKITGKLIVIKYIVPST